MSPNSHGFGARVELVAVACRGCRIGPRSSPAALLCFACGNCCWGVGEAQCTAVVLGVVALVPPNSVPRIRCARRCWHQLLCFVRRSTSANVLVLVVTLLSVLAPAALCCEEVELNEMHTVCCTMLSLVALCCGVGGLRQMISVEVPVLFSKACEVITREITQRALNVCQENKRRVILVR